MEGEVGAWQRNSAAFGTERRPIERQAALFEAAPAAVPTMLLVHLLSEQGADLLLPADNDALAVVASDFAPLVTFVIGVCDAIPLAAGRDTGRAYLCQHGICQLPATTPEQLRAQLAQLHSLRREAVTA